MAVRIPLFAIHAEDDPVCFAARILPRLYAKQVQIAVKEAIPFREFQQSPFGVLCTTSLGGHLSWFESGGGRWFAKPVSWLPQRITGNVTDFKRRRANFSYSSSKMLISKSLRRKLERTVGRVLVEFLTLPLRSIRCVESSR